MLLSAESITKTYGTRVLLDRVSFYLEPGERVGVIGVNGAGKSTLLRILAGAEEPESGCVTRFPNVRLEYLPQNPEFAPGTTVLEQVLLGLSTDARALAEYEAKTILTRLGITRFEQRVEELSGGQRKRVALAAALARPCDVLILDEPTNHLDSEMVTWLEEWLQRFAGGLVMITHDRYFLERVTNRMAEVDGGKLYFYEGSYEDFLRRKAEREESARASERKRQSILRREYQWVMQGPTARGTKSRERLERYEALKNQIDQLIHTSNLYYNVPLMTAGEAVTKASGLSKVFFTNSGTEAIEGAIKAARKYAWNKDGCTDHEIIAMKHSFHGRSMGALSVTGNSHYQEPFKPLIGGIRFADFNDLESVKAQVTKKTCAIILETVQGEGGIYPATKEFLQGVKKICEENDILLILDEIQCGMGRTGSMYAWQEYGVEPDIMTTAKALGCGVPVGAFVLNEKTANATLVPGDHGTTYGGNPFACAAVTKVFELFEKNHIVDHVNELTPYLEKRLDKLVEKYDFLSARRGKGFMQGLVVTGRPVGEILKKALENGLIVLSAGSDVIRLVPPLVIEKEHIDEMIEKLEKSF